MWKEIGPKGSRPEGRQENFFSRITKRLRQERQKEAVNQPEEVTDLTSILANTLARKGLGVTIEMREGRFVNRRTIRMDDKASAIYAEVEDSPEFQALVLSNAVTEAFLPYVESRRLEQVLQQCQWDDQTKRRVLALYWQNRAAFCQKEAKGFSKMEDPDGYLKAEEYQKRWSEDAEDAMTEARELLGESRPLILDDIRLLTEQVVDRVLAQSPKQS